MGTLPKSWAPSFCPFYASLLTHSLPFFSLSDAKSPLQQLMATINTVNFDDLFDFSPEPLELQSSPNPHPTNAATAAIPRSVVMSKHQIRRKLEQDLQRVRPLQF